MDGQPLKPEDRAGQAAVDAITGCQECEDGWQTVVVPGRGLTDGMTEDIKVVPCPFCSGTGRRQP